MVSVQTSLDTEQPAASAYTDVAVILADVSDGRYKLTEVDRTDISRQEQTEVDIKISKISTNLFLFSRPYVVSILVWFFDH